MTPTLLPADLAVPEVTRLELTRARRSPCPIVIIVAGYVEFRAAVRNPVQRGHRFQRKADSNPVIADSR